MGDGDVADTVKLLTRRADVLRALRSGRQSKRDLVDELSVSRSTVDRAVRRLESEGFVERHDGAVAISLTGRLALSAYELLATDVTSLAAAEDVLEPLSSTAPMDVSLLRNADVVRAGAVAPNQPVTELRDHLGEAAGVKGFAAGVLPSHIEQYHELIVERGSPVELVITDDVLEEVVTNYSDAFEEAAATGRFHVWLADTDLEYSLLVVEKARETVVCGMVYADRGVAGVVTNDDPRAVRWATDLFATFRADAERLQR